MRILVGVARHSLDVVFLDADIIIGQPLEDILALFRIRAATFAVISAVNGQSAGRRAEPRVVVAILVIGESHLCRQVLAIFRVGHEQRKQIELESSVPVEQLSVGMVFLKFHQLDRVTAHNLPLEIIIAVGILRIHNRSGGVCLDGIAENTPVGIVAINYTGGDVGRYGEEATFGGVAHRSTGAIFLTMGAQVDTVGVPVVGADAVVALFVAAAERQCVAHSKSRAGNGIEPVVVAAEVNTGIAPAKTHVAILLRVHHVEFLFHFVPRESA